MEYETFNVNMAPELFDRSIKFTPKDAIKELVWNACDADAQNINVSFDYEGIAGQKNISVVKIADDGHGIPFDKVSYLFGKYGCSDKTYTAKSSTGRIYHGKLGQGRYSSFSIGCFVKWITIFRDSTDNLLYMYEIRINSSDRMNVFYSKKTMVSDSNATTGTTVEITGIIDDKRGVITRLDDNQEMISEMLTVFAPYLMAYKNISIKYHDITIHPESAIDARECKEFEHEDNSEKKNAKAIAIRWTKVNSGKFYICGENGVVFDELEKNYLQKEGVSLYLMSEYFEKMHAENTLSLGEADPFYAGFYDSANKFAKEFIKENGLSAAEEEFKKIKKTEVYPYSEMPIDEINRVEQDVFDVIAVEVNRAVPELKTANASTKKLTYRLIKEAIKTNPSSIRTILSEIFNLSKEQQDEFAEMFSYTTLPAIIDTAKILGDRLTFIYMLEQMVYNDSVGKPIKERTQFHKILIKELWVFGERYALGTSDMSLKNVLKLHIRLLGREDLISDLPSEETESLTRIPDICLFQQSCIGYETFEHLVVELKRPTLTLTKKELDQIEDYAITVAKNSLFDKATTKWHFVLLGKDFNDDVCEKLKNQTVGVGNFYNAGNVSISVLQWSSIIQDNKFKYEFLRKKLNYQLSNDPDIAVDYFLKKHSELFQTK